MLVRSIHPRYGLADLMKIVVELSPPFISAKSWAIADGRTGRVLFGRSEYDRREIASLTKIMTAYTVLQLVSEFAVNIYRTTVEVSSKAASVTGTSALLQAGDTLPIVDLLYGMLLPSGNDAAQALAEYFGQLLKRHKMRCLSPQTLDLEPRLDSRPDSRNMSAATVQGEYKSSDAVFVDEMNRLAKELNLTQTTFLNPHGLHSYCNRSSAADVARLTSICMAEPLFTDIVQRKTYLARGCDASGREKLFTWENTNKLLGKGGCNGVKTGMTQTAGPCLVTSIQTKSLYFIIVLLNSKSMEVRWPEVEKLKGWAVERLREIDKISKKNKHSKRKILRTLKHI